MTEFNCPFCGRTDFKRKESLTMHIRYCEQNPNALEHRKLSKNPYNISQILYCQYCNKECRNKNSLIQHEIRCKSNPQRIEVNKDGNHFANYQKLYGSWNKNLTKETSLTIAKQAQEQSQMAKAAIKSGLITEGIGSANFWTVERRKKQSIKMSSIYTNKSADDLICGRSKKGYYKGIYCQSTWELAYLIQCIDSGINIKRNLVGFDYVFQNKEKTYYPDFYLPDEDIYVEIKGYKTAKDEAKWTQFPIASKLLVLEKQHMQPIINRIKLNYNCLDLEELYENRV